MLRFRLSILIILANLSGTALAAGPGGSPSASVPSSPLDSPSTAEAKSLVDGLKSSDWKFTPVVKRSYLEWAKAQAKADLRAAGKSVPEDYLKWIESDPVVEATVYGARQKAGDVLLMLRSLEIDLGTEIVRKNYTQLALAAAVVHAKLGPQASLSPRDPVRIVIPGDPRQPVNTKDPNRPLDLNDHIVNFLNDHAPIEEDVVVSYKEEPPELKYDDKGVAIPAPKGKPKKVPVTEKRKRGLVASDVLSSAALQAEFNAYMKEKGQSVEIHCGDQVIFPNRKEAVKGPEAKGILEAYKMIRAAYEAKGLLPAQRDPSPTPAESCAYQIRNQEHVFPDEVKAQRNWPRYPLTAPWPTLTLLVDDNQPFREREEIWLRYRDKGETRTYGEYIGPIAQQFDFQSARRLRPFPFTYGTYQMMAKDGGVCGTMANMGVRTYKVLNIPSCTAGQPGHCALIAFGFDTKSGTYNCHGGQYATAGDEGTHPHGNWVFGDVDARRDMVYHQSVAWAVNVGLPAYLDSTIAYQIYRLLPDADRQAHGLDFLASALAIDPFNILLADAAQAQAATPESQIQVWRMIQGALATVTGKPGCPADSLYARNVRAKLFANLAKMPPPADKMMARKVHEFLLAEKCDAPAALVAYEVAADGLSVVLTKTQEAYRSHLTIIRTKNGPEDDAACALMADRIKAVGDRLTDKKQRQQWATALWDLAKGKEMYFGKRNRVSTDATIPVLAKLAGQKPPPETEMVQALLVRLTAEVRASVAGERDLKQCKALAARLAEAGKSVTDETMKRQWLDALAQALSGKEDFTPKGAKAGAKPVRDPCADAIAALRTPPAKPV